ncbi:MAG TPA: phosphoribosyltransferase family protein [Thermoplasmata archaeon]|nr:phosphoribosyltransferase family protein [Thermoplasmata archaeon]
MTEGGSPDHSPRHLRDRAEAGRLLGEALAARAIERPVVLGLPRGGVPVAYVVSGRLRAPLDVLIVRKVGAPQNLEYGLGAVAEGGYRYLDAERIADAGLSEAGLAATVAAESAEVARRARAYRGGRPRVPLRGRDVIVVDDGVATGGTVLAAVGAVRADAPRTVRLAFGVCPSDTFGRLSREVDEVVTVLRPRHFFAVGEWYDAFPQVSDEEVLGLLAQARARDAAPD